MRQSSSSSSALRMSRLSLFILSSIFICHVMLICTNRQVDGRVQIFRADDDAILTDRMKSVLMDSMKGRRKLTASSSGDADEDEKSISYWMREGRHFVQSKIDLTDKTFGSSFRRKIPKNVLFFLGDGMGISSVTAGRIYVGQKRNQSVSEKGPLSFDSFPFTGLVRTYTINTQVADSASAATAITSGVKTCYNTAGVDGHVGENDTDCSRMTEGHLTESFFSWAQKANKVTAFVTTTRVTHATPSALYAHLPSRKWESSSPKNCLGWDASSQLVKTSPGEGIRLIYGGGWKTFISKNLDSTGNRTDGWDLINEWGYRKMMSRADAIFMNSTADFDKYQVTDFDYVMGLFNQDHLMYETDRKKNRSEPALHELVESALNFVQNKSGPEGYVLFVEGGKIDLAHHKNWGVRAMEEMYAFDLAIQKGLQMVDLEDTLVIVTGDHSHSLSINGYAPRSTPIHSVAGFDSYGVNYPIIMYGSGPGHQPNRKNVTEKELLAEDYKYYAGIYRDDISVHSGEDISVYATGPSAHLFTGSYDQAMIAHLLSYATCMGPHQDLCTNSSIQLTDSSVAREVSYLGALTILIGWVINYLLT